MSRQCGRHLKWGTLCPWDAQADLPGSADILSCPFCSLLPVGPLATPQLALRVTLLLSRLPLGNCPGCSGFQGGKAEAMVGQGCTGRAVQRGARVQVPVQPSLLDLEAIRTVPRHWRDDGLAVILGLKEEQLLRFRSWVVVVTGVWQGGSVGKGTRLITRGQPPGPMGRKEPIPASRPLTSTSARACTH